MQDAWHRESLVLKGINTYYDRTQLSNFGKEKFQKFNKLKFMDTDYLCIYKYKKPKFHIGLKDFYKHCENGENVLI